MEESNKIKTEENRSDKNENKVEDSTPSIDAEPEQKTPIVWEDGGEPAKKGNNRLLLVFHLEKVQMVDI